MSMTTKQNSESKQKNTDKVKENIAAIHEARKKTPAQKAANQKAPKEPKPETGDPWPFDEDIPLNWNPDDDTIWNMPDDLQKLVPLDWYDDRNTKISGLTDEPDALTDWPEFQKEYSTPRKIYDYLNNSVWKQDEAKRAAATIAYKCLNGIKDNAFFIGPTGCGKTYTWRCLQKIFPGMIEIVDGSNLTQDGWKGSTKWSDMVNFDAARKGKHMIVVIDEIDKMLMPRYSREENISHATQSEGLTILEGTTVYINGGNNAPQYQVDTSKISFVLCGAFSKQAESNASQSRSSGLGFGAVRNEGDKPYSEPLNEYDLLDYGAMPEFLGRVQCLVNLEPMTREDYYNMIDNFGGIMKKLENHYRVNIQLSKKMKRELAEEAYKTGLGIRGMENRIRRLVDNALFDDCTCKQFEF